MPGELDPRIFKQLRTKDEIVNYCRSIIAEAKAVLRQRPDPRLAVNSPAYVIFERRAMIRYGMAAQAVVDAHVFGFLSLEEMLQLQQELKAILLVTQADAQLGKPK